MEKVIELFEKYRLKAGISMNQLANSVDINVGYYSRLVNGLRKSPSYEIVIRITKFLNIPTAELNEVSGLD